MFIFYWVAAKFHFPLQELLRMYFLLMEFSYGAFFPVKGIFPYFMKFVSQPIFYFNALLHWCNIPTDFDVAIALQFHKP